MAKALPRGVRLHNPGNLRRSDDPWQGLAKIQADPEFFTFKSAEWGIRALARTLITYQDRHGCNTIRKIVTRWAPPLGDSPVKGAYKQNTAAYIADMAGDLAMSADAVIDVHHYPTLRAIVVSIIEHECANYHYPAATLDEGLRLAGVVPPAKVDRVATTALAAGSVGGAIGAADLVGLAGTLSQAKDALMPISETSVIVRGLVVALTLGVVAIGGYVVWRRYAQARAVAS